MNRVISKLRILVFGGLALAATICMFPATSNADAVVTVDGTKYDVSTVTTPFNGDPSLLKAQPWWGNSSLAEEFATAVGGSFGFPNFIEALNTGPLFAWGITPFDTLRATGHPPGASGSVSVEVARQESFVFATATPVPTPEPGALSLMFSGLLVVGLLVGVNRHRENRPAR